MRLGLSSQAKTLHIIRGHEKGYAYFTEQIPTQRSLFLATKDAELCAVWCLFTQK